MKDVMKLADSMRGKINPRYDLPWCDALEISESGKSQLDIIGIGFNLGYAQGIKAAKAEMKKARAAQ